MKRGRPRKYCRCRNKKTCAHHWILRLKIKGQPRRYVDLTEAFPNDEPDVAAAKARHHVSKPADARLTLDQVIERFGQPRTYLGVLQRLDVNGVPLGHRVMAEITGDDILQAADRHQQHAAKGKNSGQDARRHLLATARHLFNWAIRQRILTATPFKLADVAMIPVPSSRSRDRRLQGDEEARLRAACDPFLLDLVDAALETGCRGGELRTLQWGDVQDGAIILQARKTKTKRMRRIPISPTLKKLLDRRRKGPDGHDLSSDALVFGDATGKPVSRRWANRLWRAACAAAKIVDLQFHDLRHEFGSQLLEAGGELHEVQATLGHTTLGMTGRYLNATQVGVKGAFKKLEAKRRRARMKIASGQ